jgi:hypothetical protein
MTDPDGGALWSRLASGDGLGGGGRPAAPAEDPAASPRGPYHIRVDTLEEGDAPPAQETARQRKLDRLRQFVCAVLMPEQQNLEPYMDLCGNQAFDNFSQATIGIETLVPTCGREASRRCAQFMSGSKFHNFGGWGPGADAAVASCEQSAWNASCLGSINFDLDPLDGDLFGARVFGRDPHRCFCSCLSDCQNSGGLFAALPAGGGRPPPPPLAPHVPAPHR